MLAGWFELLDKLMIWCWGLFEFFTFKTLFSSVYHVIMLINSERENIHHQINSKLNFSFDSFHWDDIKLISSTKLL